MKAKSPIRTDAGDQPEFLADHREGEIGMSVGQDLLGLAAAGTGAEQSAIAEGLRARCRPGTCRPCSGSRKRSMREATCGTVSIGDGDAAAAQRDQPADHRPGNAVDQQHRGEHRDHQRRSGRNRAAAPAARRRDRTARRPGTAPACPAGGCARRGARRRSPRRPAWRIPKAAELIGPISIQRCAPLISGPVMSAATISPSDGDADTTATASAPAVRRAATWRSARIAAGTR